VILSFLLLEGEMSFLENRFTSDIDLASADFCRRRAQKIHGLIERVVDKK
jgi:hypothetical protein